MLFNQQTDSTGGGGGSSTQTPTDSAQPQSAGKTDAQVLDEMYKTPEAAKPAAEVPKVETKDTPKVEETKSATGYGEPAVPPKVEEVKPAVVPVVDPTKVEFNGDGLSEDGKTLVGDFAKKYSLSKEAAQGFADQLKSQLKAMSDIAVASQEKAKADAITQKNNWINELKTDREFGGEQFDTNLKRVDAVLKKLFPHTENLLTTSGATLPPSIMRDLQGLHKTLMSSDPSMFNSESAAKRSSPDDFLNDFYT